MKSSLFTRLTGTAIAAAAIGLCFGVTNAKAQTDASGTWKWTATTPGGQTYEATLRLQQDGKTLSGTLTGRTSARIRIQAGTIEDNAISFLAIREPNITNKYQGKFTGDAIKGTMEFLRGGKIESQDWEAKRDQPTAAKDQPAAKATPPAIDVAGTWKWSVSGQDGQATESILKLEQKEGKLAGTLTRRGNDTAITDAKLIGEDLSFSIVRERDGQKSVSKYTGKVSGDIIKGKMERTAGDQSQTRDWEAKREKTAAATTAAPAPAPAPAAAAATATATGTWKWSMARPNGETIERSVKLKQDGEKLTGASVFNNDETPIEAGQIKDGEVSFQVTRVFNDNKVVMKYRGKLNGDSIKGKIEGTFGGQDRSFDWDAKRAKE